MDSIKILLKMHECPLRKAFIQVFEEDENYKVVAKNEVTKELLKFLDKDKNAILIIACGLSHFGKIAEAEEILKVFPYSKIIIYSDEQRSGAYLKKMESAGIKALIHLDQSIKEMKLAIKEVNKDRTEKEMQVEAAEYLTRMYM